MSIYFFRFNFPLIIICLVYNFYHFHFFRVFRTNWVDTRCHLKSIVSEYCYNKRFFQLHATGEEDQVVVEQEPAESELDEILAMVFNEDHNKELSRKVEEAMLEDWDIQQGVTTARKQNPPLKINLDLWTYHGKQEFLKGNYTGAMTFYTKCIEYDPCDGRPWLGLARIYYKRGQHDLAEKCYKDGLYYNPKNPYLLQSWAVMVEKLGKLEQAATLLTKSVKSNPTHAASWVALGKLNQRFGKIDEARYCLSAAVDGDPRSYVALQAWGVLESELGNAAQSRGLFQRALDISPKSVHTLQAWATLERREGNLEKAEQLAQHALSIFPDSSRVRVTLTEIYELRGQFDEAEAVFESGQRFAERKGDGGFFQSWALFRVRRYEDAEKERAVSDEGSEANRNAVRKLFKRAVTVNRLHSASWISWAKFEERAGNPGRTPHNILTHSHFAIAHHIARRLLIAGVSNFPNSRNIGWFHCCLGHLARQQNDVNTARSCYNRALETTPSHRSLRVLLEYCKVETYHGDTKAAVKLHELAVKRFPNEDRVWESYLDLEKRRNGGDVEALAKKRELLQKKSNGVVSNGEIVSSTPNRVLADENQDWNYGFDDNVDFSIK